MLASLQYAVTLECLPEFNALGKIRASLVAQAVRNRPAKWETRVQSLGWEDPWKREWPPTPVFLPGESHGQRSLQSLRAAKSRTTTECLTLSPSSKCFESHAENIFRSCQAPFS